MTNSTINTGDTLTIRFITDAELRPTVKVIERKGNFVKIKFSENEVKRVKVYEYNSSEYIYPYGKYSMAPVASK